MRQILQQKSSISECQSLKKKERDFTKLGTDFGMKLDCFRNSDDFQLETNIFEMDFHMKIFISKIWRPKKLIKIIYSSRQILRQSIQRWNNIPLRLRVQNLIFLLNLIIFFCKQICDEFTVDLRQKKNCFKFTSQNLGAYIYYIYGVYQLQSCNIGINVGISAKTVKSGGMFTCIT